MHIGFFLIDKYNYNSFHYFYCDDPSIGQVAESREEGIHMMGGEISFKTADCPRESITKERREKEKASLIYRNSNKQLPRQSILFRGQKRYTSKSKSAYRYTAGLSAKTSYPTSKDRSSIRAKAKSICRHATLSNASYTSFDDPNRYIYCIFFFYSFYYKNIN